MYEILTINISGYQYVNMKIGLKLDKKNCTYELNMIALRKSQFSKIMTKVRQKKGRYSSHCQIQMMCIGIVAHLALANYQVFDDGGPWPSILDFF